MSLVPNVCSAPAGCQCAICKLFESAKGDPMKVPEIVLKVEKSGAVGLANGVEPMKCPFNGFQAQPADAKAWDVLAHNCGSWCPHFEARPSGREVLVTLWCTAESRPFGALRVVEPEGKGEA